MRRDRLYVEGSWVEPIGSGEIDVVEAHTGETMGSVPEGTFVDVERAVQAARAASEPFAETSVEERARLLERMADALADRADDLARTITREVGMPIATSRRVQVAMPLGTLRDMAARARALRWSWREGPSTLLRRPVGVVGAITPWNFPLHQIIAKVAPALVAGNTVVLKPSEVAPSAAFVLAEAAEQIGLPRGAFNLVTGTGKVVGEALAAHPEVDMVTFTGSTRVGRRVAELAAGTLKRVALELGGKSPSLVLDDADLTRAVRGTVADCFLNAGQTCRAHTRLLVPKHCYEEAVEIAREAAESFVVGDPFTEGTRLGPLASAAQRDRVRAYIELGIVEGARLVTGGADAPVGLSSGFFVRPTVFADVRPSMRIAQEEIFGPVLCILPYTDENDAVRIANGTIYGLAAGVWSRDLERARRVALRLRAGQIDINGAAFNPRAPFGGVKQSGLGRELGTAGLEELTELVSIQGA